MGFAEITNPERFTGIQDHQVLKVRVHELFNGGIVDYGGVGVADFKFEFEVQNKVVGPNGKSHSHTWSCYQR